MPDLASNPGPLHWERGTLATGPPGKFPNSSLKGLVSRGWVLLLPVSVALLLSLALHLAHQGFPQLLPQSVGSTPLLSPMGLATPFSEFPQHFLSAPLILFFKFFFPSQLDWKFTESRARAL